MVLLFSDYTKDIVQKKLYSLSNNLEKCICSELLEKMTPIQFENLYNSISEHYISTFKNIDKTNLPFNILANHNYNDDIYKKYNDLCKKYFFYISIRFKNHYDNLDKTVKPLKPILQKQISTICGINSSINLLEISNIYSKNPGYSYENHGGNIYDIINGYQIYNNYIFNEDIYIATHYYHIYSKNIFLTSKLINNSFSCQLSLFKINYNTSHAIIFFTCDKKDYIYDDNIGINLLDEIITDDTQMKIKKYLCIHPDDNINWKDFLNYYSFNNNLKIIYKYIKQLDNTFKTQLFFCDDISKISNLEYTYEIKILLFFTIENNIQLKKYYYIENFLRLLNNNYDDNTSKNINNYINQVTGNVSSINYVSIVNNIGLHP